MAKNLRIEYMRDKCIGNGACVRLSENFEFAESSESGEEQKATLKDAAMERKVMVEGDTMVLQKVFSQPEEAQLIKAAENCPVNAIRVIDTESGKDVVGVNVAQDEVKMITAEYDDGKEFVMDPKGYFLIRTNPEEKVIETAFCPEINKITIKITGKTPLEIYQTIIKKELVSRMDHAAYLGRELQKAELALKMGIPYVQDDELVPRQQHK